MSDYLQTTKIGDGVNFNSIIDSRFKTNRISFNLITELKKESVTKNAIIPFLLKKGYDGCSDFTAFNRELERLYGAYVSAYIQKVGDYQIMSLSITGIDDKFVFDNDSVTNHISTILSKMVLNPILENGEFVSKDVELEKTALVDTIEAEINDKRIYAINNLVKVMCEEEPFGVPKYGYTDDVLNLTPAIIKEAYDKLLRNARIEIMYTGCGNEQIAFNVSKDAFNNVKREYIELSSIQSHIKSETVKEKTDLLNVSQSKMVLGFGNVNPSDAQSVIATKLMVAVLGGTPSSKLFVNVREKLSLCYYCASRYDRFKGIMMIDCGVENQNITLARNEILAQLDCIKNGDVSDEEMKNATLSLKNALNTVYDSDIAVESWYIGQVLSNTIVSPIDEAKKLDLVSKQNIVDAANHFDLDTVYVLTGSEVE